MHRRSFISAIGAAIAVAPALALEGFGGARHEIVDITAKVEHIGENKGYMQFGLSMNASEAESAMLAFRDTAQPGDTLTLRFNGETIGTITA